MPTRISRWWIVAAVAGALAVALGAIGAHAVKEVLAKQWPEETRAARLDNWEIAARYHIYHALALMAVAVLNSWRPARLTSAAGVAFLLGMLLFSGCLYAYALTKLALLAQLVPLGGVLLIVGWCLLAVASASFRLPDAVRSGG